MVFLLTFCTFAVKLYIAYFIMEEKITNNGEEKKSLSFVEQFVKEDLEAGKNGGRLQTRFPTCVSTIPTPPRRIQSM